MRDRVGVRMGRSWVVVVGILGFGLAGAATAAWASDAAPRRSARLSYVQGNVSVERADGSGGEAAQLNMPLVQGLRLTTGEEGQAEIEFEDGSLVRITPNSALSLNNLSVDEGGDFQTQLALMHGLVYVELRSAPKYSYRIYAGGDVISPLENTTVRINLDEPPAKVSVVTGSAQVERSPSLGGDGGYRVDVRAGETFAADVSDYSRYYLTHEILPDSWDSWNEERDQAAADQAANQTTARDNFAGDQGYGWSDLDSNGSWYDVPGQGQVWQPEVAADPDFDPYGYGSWVWSPGAGYVWASGYDWGWTPYRCGNWSYWNGFGWGWMPGANCGFGGPVFINSVYVINVVHPPLGYHPCPRPVRGPGGVHPIVPVRPVRMPTVPLDTTRGPRTIAGHTVEPMRPIGNTYTSRGGSAVGASLTRDFPVERVNHQPVMGNTLGSTQAGVPARSEWPANAYRGGSALAPGQPARPMAPGVSGAHPSQGQVEPYRPAPRSYETAPHSMALPPPRTMYPPPSLPRPTYTPAPHPSYTPAPHPSYSAPAAPHPAPSAPATAPRSR